jgi:hypothetical protein
LATEDVVLLLIEWGSGRRVRGVNVSASIDDPIPSTARDADEHRIEGGVEVDFVSLNTAPVLDFEERSVVG